MQKTLSAIFLFTTLSANAAPYIGLELGIGTANHSFETNYQSDAVSLNPNMEDMFL
ncbi:TPA: multidrug ABC transporter permease, partial [Vibrio cholerae]|nr:multidrug ABC transporter permease [Vibrio cholerae]